MGIRGLSTYISRDPNYFVPFELHNTCLVIDAENYVNDLYRGSKLAQNYGGEYLEFTVRVRALLSQFRKCRITPIFMFDGCHEKQGLKHETLLKRNKERITELEHFLMESRHEDDADRLQQTLNIMPKLTIGAFLNTLDETGIHHISPDREADVHIAELACFLNCPLSSNDSDFYIFRPPSPDHKYQFIPLNTLGREPMKSCKKLCSNCPSGCYVLPCSMFRPAASLLGLMHPPLLPLLAVLVGNDLISSVRVPNCAKSMMQSPSRPSLSYSGRLIDALIRWLSRFGSKATEPLLQILSQYSGAELQATVEQMIGVISGYAVRPSGTGRELAGVLELTPTISDSPHTKDASKNLRHSVSPNTGYPVSELIKMVHKVVDALPTSANGQSCGAKPEEQLVFRWPKQLILRFQHNKLITGILDTLYVTGGSVQRGMFEDLHEQRSSIYTVVDPIRRILYNCLIGLELDNDCAYKLSGLCSGHGMSVMEYRRQADQMHPYPISVVPNSALTFNETDAISYLSEHLSLDLSSFDNQSPDLKAIRAVLVLWFRLSPYPRSEKHSSVACSSVALAFVACALATFARWKHSAKQRTVSEDRGCSQLCQSYTILAESAKRGCLDLRFSIRLVHQINELQLLVLEFRHLWCILDCLFERDLNTGATNAAENDEIDDNKQSARLPFWPDWVLFPSGRLIYWLACCLEQMRPESRLDAVLNTWLPRLCGSECLVSDAMASDSGALEGQMRLLFDSYGADNSRLGIKASS